MNRGALFVALLLTGACSELASIEQNLCGNGVVEVSEDCDSFLPHCRGCSLVCATEADCTTYGGPGFVCGSDGLCHAPAGSFLHASQVAVSVDSYRIANVNANVNGIEDPFGDVIAQSGSSVSVLYGDFAGSLSTISTVRSPVAQGPVTFARLDGDSSPDLLVPTANGIAAFTFGLGVPAPYTFPSLLSGIGNGEPLMTFNIGKQYLGGVLLVPPMPGQPARLKLAVLDVEGAMEKIVSETWLCDARANELFSDKRSHLNIRVIPAPPGPPELPPTFHAMFSTVLSSGRACVIAIDEKPQLDANPFHLNDITPPEVATSVLAAGERAILISPGENRCPTLLAQTSGGALVAFTGKAYGSLTRPCGFEAGFPVAQLDRFGMVKTGGAPLGFVPLGTSSAPEVGVVLTDGIYLSKNGGSQLKQLFVSERTLAGVDVIDLDGNALLDLVAIGVGSDDLDLLYQIPVSAMDPYGFLNVRFDTDGEVRRLLPGDYDGNSRSDIAYVERIANGDRLMIAYGTADRPLPGQDVGTFKDLFSMIRVDFADSSDPFNVVSDLAVLYGVGAGKRLALLHGSPQRTMQAFYDPRQAIPDLALASPIANQVDIGGVIPGRFKGGLGGQDILGLASTTTSSNLYLTPASPAGALSSTARCGFAPTLKRCSAEVATDELGAELCTNLASYLAWPVASGHDVVVGVDGVGNAVTFDPPTSECGMSGSPSSTPWSTTLALPPSHSSKPRRVRSIAAVESGGSELAISFAPPRGGDPRDAALRVCTLANGVAEVCEDPAVPVSMHAGRAVICTDLAAGRATRVSRFGDPPPPVADLFAVCGEPGERIVYRISRYPDRTQVDALLPIGDGDEIEIGDVNGDAVDDIVVLVRGATDSMLHVYTQCTSRNAADCEQVQAQVGMGEKNP